MFHCKGSAEKGRGCARGNEAQDEARERDVGKRGGEQIHGGTGEVRRRNLAGLAQLKIHLYVVGEAAIITHVYPLDTFCENVAGTSHHVV